MKNTIYVVAEAQNIPDNGTVPYAYATVYPTKAAAKRGLRKMVKDIVQANYEGNDDIEASDINDEVNSIIQSGDGTNWYWEANDRSAVWRILEVDIAQFNNK